MKFLGFSGKEFMFIFLLIVVLTIVGAIIRVTVYKTLSPNTPIVGVMRI